MSPHIEEAAPDVFDEITPENFGKEREVGPEEYIEASRKLAIQGLEIVRERFGTAEHPKDGFDYHNEDHSAGAANRAEQILLAARAGGMTVTDEDIALARTIASFHDTVQQWNPKLDWPHGSEDQTHGRIYRARYIGTNEQQSVEEILEALAVHNRSAGKTVFTQKDALRAQEAIRGTVPKWDPELQTVVQPNLNAESSLIARAAAMADLAEAGMATESYLHSGDALFREENIDMNHLDVDTLSETQKTYYKTRMVKWLNVQIHFAEGRKKALQKETEGLPETVRTLFDSFDRSIDFSQARADAAEKKSFEELYREMGF